MKQFAIIGLGSFGTSMAEELVNLKVELILIDGDEGRLELWKQRVRACYVVDEDDIVALREIVPEDVDACIIDLGGNVEASVLMTHHLKKLGCRNILVRANSESHAEIVGLLGATKVVFPDREAAKRLVPSLVNDGLISFTPVGGGLAFAEVPVDQDLVGLSIRQTGFRDRHGLNIIALRAHNSETFVPVTPDDRLELGSVLLVAGLDQSVRSYTEKADRPRGSGKGKRNPLF